MNFLSGETIMRKCLAPLILVLCAVHAFSEVPASRLRTPDMPGFLQSMSFQTLQTQVFPREIAGMIPDAYSDLSWNPANLRVLTRKSVYLDFQSSSQAALFPTRGTGVQAVNYRSGIEDQVAPRWYPQTSIRSTQTAPLYNFGILIPLHSRLSIGFFNRTVFDYGPFLQGSAGTGAWDEKADYASRVNGNGTLVPQRMEADENQQTAIGNQFEVTIGYKLSGSLDIGLRLGHMVYGRRGDLLNDRWANYPHSTSADLEDESLKINGHHVEAGLGLVYHPDSTSRFGLYGGLASGNGTEKSLARDTTHTWSETDTDTRYFNMSHYALKSNQVFSEKGSKPLFTLSFEKRLSGKWLFRTSASASWSNVDVTGNIVSSDTSAGDRTFDQWDNSATYFRRLESHGSRTGGLTGEGTEKTRSWEAFASVIYSADGRWSMFAGVHVQRYTFGQDFTEVSNYQTHVYNKYSIYKPEINEENYYHEKDYTLKNEYSRWSAILPVGFQIRVARGFSVLMGSGIAFSLEDESASGDRLYPTKITQRRINGQMIVNDGETDRYETFSSNPARVLNRQWGRYFGIVYEHPCGSKVFLKFSDDFSQMNNWAFGFSLDW
jgi:hypothetical protein